MGALANALADVRRRVAAKKGPITCLSHFETALEIRRVVEPCVEELSPGDAQNCLDAVN